MRDLIFLAVIFILVTSSCNSQQSNAKKLDFSVEILNLYFGRVENITLLTNDSIKSEIGKTKEKTKKYGRKLVKHEMHRIQEFMKEFPINNLENQYINDAIEDGF